MLVPLVYLVVALGQIQGQALGAEAGARHVARAIASAPDAATASARADAVLRSIVDEYGIDTDEVELSLSCRPAGSACPEAGATVVVTIATRVAPAARALGARPRIARERAGRGIRRPEGLAVLGRRVMRPPARVLRR